MANHPNRSQAGGGVMPDEAVDLRQQKAARVLKFMGQATSHGMTDGMLRQPKRKPEDVLKAMFPGSLHGEQGHIDAIVGCYSIGFAMGQLYQKT